MLKSVFGFIIKYLLDVCEQIGLFTAKFAVKSIKALRVASFNLRDRVGSFAKRWGRTFHSCVRAVITVFNEIINRTKRNAAKYGAVSGFYKFFEELKKNTVKNKQFVFKAFNYTAPFIAVVIVFFIATSFNNVTLAYEVKYDGETLGFVSDEEVYSQASDIVKNQVEGNAELTTEPVLSVTLVPQSSISSADDLSEKIIETSGELTDGFGLYINEKFILASKNKDTIDTALQTIKENAIVQTSAQSADFVDEISVRQGTYCDIQLMDKNRILTRLTPEILSVKTVKLVTKTEVLKFNTITAKDNTKFEGYKKITVKGENGEMMSTVETAYVNGKVQSEITLDTVVTKAAIDEQIIIGTHKTDNNVSMDSESKFSWPVERVASSYVSQYYGHYGHTGLDIAAYRGTQIYAAGSGVVTEVIYSNASYGNHFKVDCGNGVITMYAHCNTVDVEVGDVVTMGDPIATVGSTGNSTGPHLHFEVIVNGTQVNPGPYVGLN